MTATRGKYEIDMTHGALLPKILLFAVPLIFSSILQLLFNAADIVVVGRFGRNGAHSIAAVGSTGSLINLIVALFIGLSVGVNVVAARYFAAGEKQHMSETVHTSTALSIIGGVLVGALGFVIARPVLTLMGTPPEVLPLAVTYMRIYFVGAPVLFLYNLGSAILRAVGDTRRPLYFLIISGVINVILNLFFVIVLRMDVAGVAAATVLSEAISAVLILRCLIMTKESYRLTVSAIRVNRHKLGLILKIGVPAGVQSMIFSFSNVLIQSSVNSFGAVAMAGNAAGSNLEGFVYMAMNAIYQASVSFTSQNYGAGDMKRVNRVLLTCLATVFVIGAAMGNLFYLFGGRLLSLYTNDPAAIEFGLRRMGVICTLYFLCGLMDTVCGSIRGLGWSVVPMVVSLIGACGFRIVWIYTYFRVHHELTVLYLSYPISWALTGTVHLICFLLIRRHLDRTLEEKAAWKERA
ncbi:MAG: MATE family efflux transporter [Lachnospiraceae bacterium]|nr:MATE family efflux transporter [Lachnospiraceae bacterium]